MPGGIDYNLLAGMGRSAAESHSAGLQNRLVLDQVARDDVTRNALTGYLESPQEERDTRLNALVAADPTMAANVLTIEHARADRAQMQKQQHAQRALTELQAIKGSQNPGLAFRLMAERPDEDNPLRGLMEQLSQAGAINPADGISDEEAAQITDLAIVQLTPVAGAQDVERADPADVRSMQLLGYELTPEGFAQYNADKGAPGDAATATLAAIQAQLAIDQRRDQIERDRKADELAAETRTKERTTLRNTVRRSIGQTEKIAHLTEKLEGSFLEAGMPVSSWRRLAAGAMAGAGAAIGLDTSKLRGDLDAYDQLKKNLSDQLINLMSTGGLGEGTNSKLQQYQDALASTETSPGAIMAIQANIAETLLEESDNQGFEVFDRDKVEANIEKWRGYETPAGEAVIDAPEIARRIGEITRMTVDQLGALDPAAMTEEMVDAAAKRWDESMPASNPFREELDRRIAQVKGANPFAAERERRAAAAAEAPSANYVARELGARGAVNSILALPSASGDLLAAASAGAQMFNPATPVGMIVHKLRGTEAPPRPSFGERFQAEREKFPASALRAIPRPTVRDITAGAKSIPALVPGGETPGDAFERHGAEFDAEEAAMREAHPVAATVGEIGGDVLSLLLGRRATGLDRVIQRGETRLTGHAAVEASKTMADDLGKIVKSSRMQQLARAAGRSVETGVESAVLDILKDPNADPLETAAIAAGGQLVGSGALGAAKGLVGKGWATKITVAAMTTWGLLQVLKSATPGGEDKILESMESGYDKVALMLGLGAGAAAIGATRYGRGNTNFSGQSRAFLDGIATVHRGTLLSLLSDWTEGDEKQRGLIENVLTKLSEDPAFKGATAAERSIVRQLKDGSELKPVENRTGGRF